MGFVLHSRAAPKKNPTASGQFVILQRETAINFLKSKLKQLPEALPPPWALPRVVHQDLQSYKVGVLLVITGFMVKSSNYSSVTTCAAFPPKKSRLFVRF